MLHLNRLSAAPRLRLQRHEDRVVPAVFVVTTTADDFAAPPAGSLRAALNAANANGEADTITFADALGTATVSLDGSELAFTAAALTTIDGGGDITINANFLSSAFRVNAGAAARIDGLTVTKGNSGGQFTGGGGILNLGTLTLNHVTLTGNNGGQGGGIANSFSATLVMNFCTVSDNTAVNGGGIQNEVSANLTLNNCTVSDNTATFDGGGVRNLESSALTLINSTVSGNQSGKGGGIYNETSSNVTLTNSTVASNVATVKAGGISNSLNGVVTMTNTIVAGNSFFGADPSDIANTAKVTAAFSLIGDAATSGGLTHGVSGNIVGNAGSGTIPIATT